MKKLFPFLLALITIISISCQKDEIITSKRKGILTVDIGLLISDNLVNSGLKSAQAIEDFKVTVFRENGTPALLYETAAEMPDTIQLEPGNYYVEAHSNNNLPAAFENPYYYGVSEVFTITSNTQQSVTVTCSLANTMVSVGYSSATMNSFTDYSTSVSSATGSLIFLKDETRMGYFQPSPLDIQVSLTWLNPDGTQGNRTLSGSISQPLAGHHYGIMVNTSVDNGSASFQLLLDESEIPVEIVEIFDQPETQADGLIPYGALLITEIMFDPSVLSDTQGEWFEIYNSSDQIVNLQGLVLERDSINRHVITDSIELLPGQYYLMARTSLATAAANSYVYGSAISLPNTGAVLSVYNKDSDTGPGALIFSVDYGAVNFPARAGASITLNPNLLNVSDAITGTSWCTSISLYNTGDAGTPGIINDSCL